ncbi:fructokinase [Ranunculus cassubicifolius]
MNWVLFDAAKVIGYDTNGGNKEGALVVCFGEMLIDFVPTVAGVSIAEAPAFKKAPGGAPANVAVGISRLGGKSAFMGKVNSYISIMERIFLFSVSCLVLGDMYNSVMQSVCVFC